MSALDGRTVLVTRAEEDARAWVDAIASRGGRAMELPCISREIVGGAVMLVGIAVPMLAASARASRARAR